MSLHIVLFRCLIATVALASFLTAPLAHSEAPAAGVPLGEIAVLESEIAASDICSRPTPSEIPEKDFYNIRKSLLRRSAEKLAHLLEQHESDLERMLPDDSAKASLKTLIATELSSLREDCPALLSPVVSRIAWPEIQYGKGDVVNKMLFTPKHNAVLVKYVAGTLPADNGQREDLLGKLGCLVPTDDALVFVKYNEQGAARRLGGFLSHLASPSWAKGMGQCYKTSAKGPSWLAIRYSNMQVLQRGHVQNMSSQSSGDFSLIGAVGSLAGAAALNSTAGYIGLGAVSGAALGYYLNRKTMNYITIFVKRGPAESADDKKETKSGGGSGNSDKYEFAVFQVIDPHDYWNTSVLLYAKTGREFTMQSAAKSASSQD